ncbi:MAG TPA: iron-containing alcohol dehydrogenase [Anaerolineae bacterium]|nr:iron-containing alcohol dehydrogenase [Anaerolineae bacterium]
MDTFNYTSYAQEIIFGSGAINQIGEAAERFHWQRLLLCTSPSLRPNGHIAPIEAALGQRLVAAYEKTQSHVLDFQLDEVLEIAAQAEVEAVIGLGGGSPIGLAKAVSLALEARRTGQPARAAFPTDQPLVPVIAIPTTYAGSEMTPVYGVTHQTEATTRKITVRDAKIAPKLVIYDPSLTLNLPPGVTAGTGINALAHCIEAVYSVTRHPLSTAAALSGIQYITRALLRCYTQGDDLEARTEMLRGAHLGGTALASVTMGLHHGLCHVLGGTAGVPHGVANAIILPHALRFNLDVTAPQLAQVAAVMGLAVAGQSDKAAAEAAIQHVYNLIGQLGLPQRLREAGVNEADLPHLAQLALKSSAVQSNPKPLTDAAQAEAIFRASW